MTKSAGECRSHIGDKGELWFAHALPQGWIWQPPRRDLGKDALIVIRDGSELHNLEFYVQIKTSTRPISQGKDIRVKGISKTNVMYWFSSPLPMLIVAVNTTENSGWYAWLIDIFDSPKSLFKDNASTVAISIPHASRLDETGWTSIRASLLKHYRAIQRAFDNDTIASYVLTTVNSVSRIIGNLIRLGSGAPPEPPLTKKEGLALLVEQIELRDLIATVYALLCQIQVNTEAYKYIESWIASFEAMANAGHPSLTKLPPSGFDIQADFTLIVSPSNLIDMRPRLVLASIDLIRTLTSSKPP